MITFANFVGAAPQLAALVALVSGATVLLAIAGLASIMLRKKSAAVRYCVWQFAIAGLLMMPALYFVLPGWSFGISLPLFAETGDQLTISSDARMASLAAEGSARPLKIANRQASTTSSPLPATSSKVASLNSAEPINPKPHTFTSLVVTEQTSPHSSMPFSWRAWVIGAWIM